MPAYSKTTWSNGNLPAIDATNLNKIEQGIFDSLRQDGSTTMSGQLVTTAGSAATPAIAPTGDSNTGIFFPSADTLSLGTAGAEQIRIESSGYVGMGLTASYRLDVASYAATPIRAQRSGEYGEVIKIGRNGVSDGAGIGYPADNAFSIITNSNERIRITSSGTVGIGETNPSSILHLSSATASYSPSFRIMNTGTAIDQQSVIALYTNNSTSNQFLIGKNNIAAGASVFLSNQANSSMIFETNATTRMTITGAGNVGIGVNPNVELHVKGTGEIFRLETTAATGDNFIRFYAPSGVTQGYVGYTSAANNHMNMNQVLNNDLLFHTNNTERFRIEAAGTTRPAANNTYDLGSATYRWATIYAQNALNTSDARLKKEVTTSSLGLDFINQLNPVQYKWIEGGNSVDRVQTGTETVEIAPAIPAQPEQPEVLDEEGNVIQEYVPATEEVPAVTEERPTYEEVVTPREGVRTHFGLIAQEVKAALPDGLDFAGWCLADKDDPESTQSLGYTNFIAPMIKAIQELSAEVQALKAQLNK
jgi:hypothetical protein